MTLSILWVFMLLIFVLIACFQSRNRLNVYAWAMTIALIFLGLIYVLDKYALNLRIATLISEVFNNMFRGIFAAHHLSQKDLRIVIWAFSMLVFFLLSYILLHVFFKYIFIGRNPLLPYRKKDYFSHVLISGLFILCGFVFSTFVFTFIMPLSDLEVGFMKPFFDYLYGGLKI